MTPGLVPAREADDHLALARAGAACPTSPQLASHPAAVRLLWEVCQIPDFRKVMSDTHARLLAQIYRHLAGPHGAPAGRLGGGAGERGSTALDGDIDTLMTRIAHIRTWTYIAHRAGLARRRAALAGARARHRGQALRRAARPHHPALRRSALGLPGAQARRARRAAGLGEPCRRGQGRGPLCRPARRLPLPARSRRRRWRAPRPCSPRPTRAARRDRARASAPRARRTMREFALDAGRRDRLARRRGRPAGRRATSVLAPSVEALPSDFFEGEQREAVRQRLAAFVARDLRRGLAAALPARARPRLSGPARGLVFQLGEALGSLPASRGWRRWWPRSPRPTASGCRGWACGFGVETVYFEPLLKPEAVGAARACSGRCARGEPVPPVARGHGRAARSRDRRRRLCGDGLSRAGPPRAARRPGRAPGRARRGALARQGAFAASPELAQLAGCAVADLPAMLAGAGLSRRQSGRPGRHFPRRRPGAARAARNRDRETARSPSSRS